MQPVLQVPSAVPPKAPSGSRWKEMPCPPGATLGYPGRCFRHKPSKLMVISAVEFASQARGLPGACVYHVSVSKNGRRRCSPAEAAFVLRVFDLDDAEEDNHVPYGIVRNFWRPVADNRIGEECPCKATEPAMVEDKGSYVWRG